MTTVLILDFGSQYTQLIARRVRELEVYSIIEPCTVGIEKIRKIKPQAIILSGGPASVYDKGAPAIDARIFKMGIPILGICYGMQTTMKTLGGKVHASAEREYGKAAMQIDDHKDLFFSLPAKITSWMSHGDSTEKLPKGFDVLAHTSNTKFAAVGNRKQKLFGVQFHPEVVHTEQGLQIISNFLFRVADCKPDWELGDFIERKIADIRKQVGSKGKIILGLSGGVDSSVAAVLLHKAVGKRLTCIFVDNGLLRKGEISYVREVFEESFKMNLTVVDAGERFLKKLAGVVDPEQKRKIIGHEFIAVFDEEAQKVKNVGFLAQGTLYPDVIESVPFFGGPTAKIKSHHNVGCLPEKMKLKLVEPFRELFKDEVRAIGRKLNVPEKIVTRQPFPGPGLAVRIIGDITKDRLHVLKEADARIEAIIRKHGLYEKIWQSFGVLLPIKTVGVMGDQRTYENVVALRSVNSVDGMTADWTRLPYEVLEEISSTVINNVRGVNRVVFDISQKPPSTIEWE
jgi:GMP synthase (glutamine-hydrolysing)